MLNRRQVEKTLGSGASFLGTARQALPSIATVALLAVAGLAAGGLAIQDATTPSSAGTPAASSARTTAAVHPAVLHDPRPMDRAPAFDVRVVGRSEVVPAGPSRVETIRAVATPVSWTESSPRRAAARDDADESAEPTDEQRNIARFVASKYRLTVGEVQRFVEHAYQAAREFRLDPYLVLAVVSIESSFNPNARNPSGAQGLMQVLTRVHTDKFAPFGGSKAAFDPVANLAVGSQILKEYIVREGSVQAALKSYVGAAMLPHDHGYGNKVLIERERIVAAATGKGDPAPQVATTETPKTGATSTVESGPDERRSSDGTNARSADTVPAPSADAVQARAARIEAARIEAARAEAARAETARAEAARAEAAHAEAERTEVAKARAAEIEAARIDAERTEAERTDAARIKAAQIDAALAETARLEAARLEAARQGTAAAEALSAKALSGEVVSTIEPIAPATRLVMPGARITPAALPGTSGTGPATVADGVALSVARLDAQHSGNQGAHDRDHSGL